MVSIGNVYQTSARWAASCLDKRWHFHAKNLRHHQTKTQENPKVQNNNFSSPASFDCNWGAFSQLHFPLNFHLSVPQTEFRGNKSSCPCNPDLQRDSRAHCKGLEHWRFALSVGPVSAWKDGTDGVCQLQVYIRIGCWVAQVQIVCTSHYYLFDLKTT